MDAWFDGEHGNELTTHDTVDKAVEYILSQPDAN